MNHRIAIVVAGDLSAGEAANAAAIVTGQIARSEDLYFNEVPVIDADGTHHASVNHSVVVLKARNQSQLCRLAQGEGGVPAIAFSRTGQTLNNAFEEYSTQITRLSTPETAPVAVAVFGPDAEVRKATRKFSVLS